MSRNTALFALRDLAFIVAASLVAATIGYRIGASDKAHECAAFEQAFNGASDGGTR